ncbi:MAG: sodium:solute symporter family protein [Candidatus Aminicenantes bacterium]|nr:sodium:solute symporter family protein [Candidatus Aminicenantes bacterium]
MNWIPLSIVLIYIILLYLITWLTRRLSRGGMVAYLLAGRGLPFWVVAPLLTGLAVGGASTVGVAQSAYKNGISAGWYNAAWAAGAFLVGLFAASRYRKMEVATLPEFFERHYSISGRVIGVIGQLLLQIVIISVQYVAGGAILSSLLPDISFHQGMFITAVVFVGITLIGGFWAAGLTNIINVILIYVGVLLGAIIAIGKIGGLRELVARIPSQHPGFDLGAIGFPLILAWFIVMCTMAFSVQSVVQISFAAKHSSSAKKGFILGGLIILPVGFISAVIGIAASILHPGIIDTAEALPRTVLSLSPLVAGLVLAGLWAADVSTASALLVGSATLVVGDLIKRFTAPDLQEKGERVISRITVFVLSVFTYLLAVFVSSDILKTLLIGLSLTTGYTLVTLMTLFWPQVCRRGHATWTLLMSMAALAVWFVFPRMASFFQGIRLPHPIYFCWIVSLVTFFLVAVIDRRKIKEQAD